MNKDFVADGMSNEEIKKQVKYVREYLAMQSSLSRDEKTNFLQDKCKAFFDRYPMLFDMCLQQDFSHDNLNYFLSMREKIISDQITSEDASKEVGKVWFEKFIDLSKCPEK